MEEYRIRMRWQFSKENVPCMIFEKKNHLKKCPGLSRARQKSYPVTWKAEDKIDSEL